MSLEWIEVYREVKIRTEPDDHQHVAGAILLGLVDPPVICFEEANVKTSSWYHLLWSSPIVFAGREFCKALCFTKEYIRVISSFT